MTDFCISAVRYNDDRKHIAYVRVHQDLNNKIGTRRTVERAFVADFVRLEKASFQTITFNATTKKWENGARVHVIEDEFLTTDRNSTKRDNLGNLPEF
ncbi:DUF3892 domain-containing protein [Pseudomonas sp. NPDC047961]